MCVTIKCLEILKEYDMYIMTYCSTRKTYVAAAFLALLPIRDEAREHHP